MDEECILNTRYDQWHNNGICFLVYFYMCSLYRHTGVFIVSEVVRTKAI